MKRSLLTLTAAAALTLGGAASAQAATTCYSIDVPAVPAVYETVIIPAVTVTEYEFTHAQDGNGQGNGGGPENKWTEDANWNSQGNAHSIGWTATGNTRVKVLETERTTVTLVAPEVPASVREECVVLPDGESPVKVGDTEVPLGNQDPVPAEAPVAAVAPAQEAPAPVAVQAPAAPLADVGAPTQAASTQPEELAYTGAADWGVPAGIILVGLGGAAVAGSIISRRRIV